MASAPYRGHDASPITAWDLIFRAAYAFIRLTDPLLRWTWFSVGLGITSRLTVRGRRTGRKRSVLVGLIRVDRVWYVGHPNGEVAWTSNLRQAGQARVAPRPEAPLDVSAQPLEAGRERDAVIVATAAQQPFPANLLYRGARRHILSEGPLLPPQAALKRGLSVSVVPGNGGELESPGCQMPTTVGLGRAWTSTKA